MKWHHGWKFRLLLVALLALLGVEPFLGNRLLARLGYTTLWSLVLIATILGQFYLAVLVAGLVGIRVSRRTN